MAFKPTPSIAKEQKTVDLQTMEQIPLVVAGRHDPCIVPRAVPVVEAVTCLLYTSAPDEADRAYLNALAAQMNAAVEEFGWDGNWYLRAYADDGEKLGAAEAPACRIDAICQAWAALVDLAPARVSRALDAAWEQLVDEEHGLVKLLTPPFDGNDFDPGYILSLIHI